MSFRAPPELARYKLDAIFDENTVTHHPSNRQPPPGMESATTVWGSDKVLGSGTFGTVWLQKEKQTGTLRAVKIISKSQSDTQELKTLVNLHDCPDNFVQFIAWFEDANSIHIAMEYIPYGDLSQYLTTYSERAKAEAKTTAKQILAGLAILHGRQICHRDLKPQNILLVSLSPIVVKLTDFGISKNWAGSSLRTHCGTVCYQAPEQLGLLPRDRYVRDRYARENSYTSAIDIWALGEIVHQMLTSEIPFLDTYQDLFLSDLDSLPPQEDVTLDMGLIVDYCRGLSVPGVDIGAILDRVGFVLQRFRPTLTNGLLISSSRRRSQGRWAMDPYRSWVT